MKIHEDHIQHLDDDSILLSSAHIYAIENNKYKEILSIGSDKIFNGLMNIETNKEITNPYDLLFLNNSNKNSSILKSDPAKQIIDNHFSNLAKSGATITEAVELEKDFKNRLKDKIKGNHDYTLYHTQQKINQIEQRKNKNKTKEREF